MIKLTIGQLIAKVTFHARQHRCLFCLCYTFKDIYMINFPFTSIGLLLRILSISRIIGALTQLYTTTVLIIIKRVTNIIAHKCTESNCNTKQQPHSLSVVIHG